VLTCFRDAVDMEGVVAVIVAWEWNGCVGDVNDE